MYWGGVDSSTVAALMQVESRQPIRTFTIGFAQQGYDEARHAKCIAAHIGTEHTEFYVEEQIAREAIPLLPQWYDEPFADSSAIPTRLVSQLARQHVTVALSGDGGDEVFAGYTRHRWGETLERARGLGLAAITDVAMRRLFAPEFQAQHPDLMQGRREAFLKTDPEVLQAACAQLAELDLRGELARVKVPVLVLVGEHDEATPPPMSHELAANLPNARLKIIAGCAHVPQLQSPEAFLDAIGDFLPAPHAAI